MEATMLQFVLEAAALWTKKKIFATCLNNLFVLYAVFNFYLQVELCLHTAVQILSPVFLSSNDHFDIYLIRCLSVF